MGCELSGESAPPLESVDDTAGDGVADTSDRDGGAHGDATDVRADSDAAQTDTNGRDAASDTGDSEADGTGDGDAGSCCTYVAGNPWACRYEPTPVGTIERYVTSASELQEVASNVSPGDTVLIEPGTYSMGETLRLFTSGTDSDPIRLVGSSNGDVILDFSSVGGNGILIRAAHLRLQNFAVENSGNNGIKVKGKRGDGGTTAHHITVEDLEVRGHDRNGIAMIRNTHDNVVRHTRSHDNGTTDNGDGIAMPSAKTDTGPQNQDNLIDCVSVWRNTDDGVELFANKNSQVQFSMAWRNGYDSQGTPVGDGNGYKLGGENDSRPYESGGHLVLGNISFDNRNRGFNYNLATIPMEVYHNTAFGNGGRGYRFRRAKHVLKNNVGYDNAGNAIGDQVVEAKNNWNLGIGDPQYVSTSRSSSDFLLLPAGSAAVDAGVSLPVPWQVAGSAPDLGARERGAAPP